MRTEEGQLCRGCPEVAGQQGQIEHRSAASPQYKGDPAIEGKQGRGKTAQGCNDLRRGVASASFVLVASMWAWQGWQK